MFRGEKLNEYPHNFGCHDRGETRGNYRKKTPERLAGDITEGIL